MAEDAGGPPTARAGWSRQLIRSRSAALAKTQVKGNIRPPLGHKIISHADHRDQQLLPRGCQMDKQDIFSKAREDKRVAPGPAGRHHPFPHTKRTGKLSFPPKSHLMGVPFCGYLRRVLKRVLHLTIYPKNSK